MTKFRITRTNEVAARMLHYAFGSKIEGTMEETLHGVDIEFVANDKDVKDIENFMNKFVWFIGYEKVAA